MVATKAQTPKKVSVEKDLQGLTIVYHWRNWGFIFLILFGLVWTGLTVFMVTIGEMPLAIRLLLLLFPCVGAALLYWSLGKVINRTEIRVQGGQLTARHRPLPWRGNVAVPVSDIKKVTSQDYYVESEDDHDMGGVGISVSMKFKHHRVTAITQDGQHLHLVPDIDRFDAADFMAQELAVYLGQREPMTTVEKEAAQVARTIEADREEATQAASILPFWSLLMPFFTIVGIYLLVLGAADYLEARDSQDWPSTEGHVVDSRIVYDTRTDSDGDKYTLYRPEVTYEYTVQDQAYTSNRIDLNDWSSSRDRSVAARELKAYPLGGEVTVFYNPKNPSKALLDRSMPPYTYLIIGLVLLGCAAMLGAGLLLVRRGIAKATGEVPRWEELIFWLKYIPGLRG